MSERLSILNEDYKVLPGSQSLHKLIKWSRDTCALDFLDNDGERRTYSYRALRKCVLYTVPSLQKVWWSQDRGTGELQRIIPVLVPQSPGLYVAILAILEAGAAFCPLNLDAPPERIRFVVEDVSAEVIVTTREYEHLVRWQGGPKVVLIDDVPTVPEASHDLKSNLSLLAPPHDLAYVMYTSGSSGTPKGVAVSHLAVSQSLLAHDRHIPHFSRFLQFASPSFDVSVFEIFFPLFRGSTLVGCRRPRMLNDLTGVITKLEVDAVELTPTVISSLVQHRSNVPSLSLLMTIGEMLTRPVVESFGKSGTHDGILYAMYGPTEAAIHCTIYAHMAVGTNVANIGIPFDTVSAFIVAPDENPIRNSKANILPIGEVGELVLGGPQLADEYLNRKEQNETSFMKIHGQRVYRTGDKARITMEGTIEISGRISSGQVKIRGQRVELGEIEDAIYRHPHITNVLTSVLHGVVIAFVLSRDRNLKAEEVLEACSTWLPSFMVPSEIVILNIFPHLPSGKVNKKKLEADFERRKADEGDEAAQWRSPAEQTVSKIIHDLLGVNVSHNTRLATYGIDSLVAIRMGALLRNAGYFLSSVEILKADDIRSLAHLCELSQDAQKSVAPPITHMESFLDDATIRHALSEANIELGDIEYTMPCTPIQNAMLSETSMDGVAYKNQIILETQPHAKTKKIIEALQALAQNNSILRTGFIEVTNEKSTYLQVIWKAIPSSQFELVEDLSGGIDSLQTLSILHPLHVQISQADNHTRFSLRIHHAIYDAWSLELILDDLETVFSGKQLHSRPSYANIVAARCGRNSSENVWPSKTYWKDHFSLFDFVPIPSFHSVTNIKRGLSAATHATSIATRDLESAARVLGVASQSLFQTAYALILSSYLGTKDICFGTVFSGRTSPIAGIENIIGPCLATFPIRTDLSTATTMADLARQLNLRNRKHLEHDSLPLREIKKACGIEPGKRMFDSLIIWQQTLHGYDHKRDHVRLIDSADYLEVDLTLEITPSLVGISIKANYQQSLFPSLQIDILLRQLEQLVATIIRAPETTLDSSSVFLNENLLSVENVDPQISLHPGSLTSPVESMAIDYPDKVAIEFANSIEDSRLDVTQITYAELNSKANQIAHYLISLKVLPDELVCVCLEKSAELYLSILAICKAGAGYVPATPDTPAERLRKIISDSHVEVIVTHSSLVANLESFKSRHLIFVDKLDWSLLSSRNPDLKFQPDHLAYCVFTSGSTGTPKGVLVTQGNLLSNLQILAELYPHNLQSKLLQSCSQAFDVSVFEIFFAWHIGACLCSAVKDVMFRDIELSIRALDITHLSLTPTVAALIDPENLPKVKFLVTAGEAVTAKVFNAWADRGLYQGYGPSETTNICTVRPNVTKHHAINNIGPPLRNTIVFVLSPGDEFSLAPRGGEGEFCFGGAQVGRGYLDLHQRLGKFIEHSKYGRLYRSGDYGRLLPDGSLSFSGRKDDQVKLRGQRIELGEINSALLRSPEVMDCISLIIEGNSQAEQRLVCSWVPNGSPAGDFCSVAPDFFVVQKLFTVLVEALPTYMIPSALIPVSCLPSTAQGKVDKRRLTSHYKSLSLAYLNQVAHMQETSSDHDWTQLEKEIVSALAKIAKTSPSDIGPDTSFFSLGIDSVSAISLSRVLRDALEVHVEISDILKYPSVSRLASRLSQAGLVAKNNGSSESDDFGFDPDFLATTTKSFKDAGVSVERILPCTPLQEAMLSAAETASSDAYNNRLLLEIKVGEAEFQHTWAEMIKRHEILRTCFIATSQPQFAYAQVVLSNFSPQWEIISRLDENSTQDIQSLSSTRTDYEPPYSLQFLRSSRGLMLNLYMHHVIYDGYAFYVLFKEIEMALKQLPLLSQVSFVPFIEYMLSVDLVQADAYWGNLLDDLSPSQFPQSGNVIKSRNSEHGPSSVTKLQSDCNLNWVDAQVKNHDTSLLSIIQAVWASVLSSLMNQADICFGNVVSGRTVPVENVDRLVAPCFNTIPVRLKELDRLSFLEAFRELQSQSVNGFEFQLTPLRRIQYRSTGQGVRLFDTLLILQQRARPLNPSLWSAIEDSGTMDLPVVLEITPQTESDAIVLTLHTHTRCVSDSEAAKLLKSFDDTLKIALQNPRHPMLSPSKAAALNKRQRNYKLNLDIEIGVDYGSENPVFLSPVEMIILDVMAKFTNIPRVRIRRQTTIYRLGLDSISAVQVAADLRKRGYNVMGSDVLQHPSIAQLAMHISSTKERAQAEEDIYNFREFDQRHRENICTRLKRPSEHIEAIRPCTPVQCGMLAQTLRTNGQEYINSLYLELISGSSLSKIRSAWELCMRKYEMLRTGFAEIEDAKSPFAMVTYNGDVFALPWTERNDFISNGEFLYPDSETILLSLSHCPWTLEVCTSRSATIIRFTAHHAIYDAESLDMILSDVVKFYKIGATPLRRGVSINFVLSAILKSKDHNEAARKKFWQEENKICINRFPDLTPLRLSTTKSSVLERISALSMSQLEKLCRKQDASIQAAGQVAWARLLSSYIGETSVTFGMTLSGRTVLEGTEQYAFPTIVTLPVSRDIIGTNAELLSSTMRSNSQLHEHQLTPLTSIQKWVGHPEGKLFDTLFAYQKINSSAEAAECPWKVMREEASADYTVSMEIQPVEDGSVRLRLTFKDSIVPVEQAKVILDQYDALLLDTLQNTEASSAAVPRLSFELLAITPATEPTLQSPVQLLHEFVELQALRIPQKTALEYTRSQDSEGLDTSSWSFKQLDSEGNKIANLILGRGAKNGDLIAICFNKCPEASFAILGILKAGCTYVALDPNAPPDRLKFIVQDSKSSLILSVGEIAQTLSGIFAESIVDKGDIEVLDLGKSGLLAGLEIAKPVLAIPIGPQDTCYCLYTSGTTGTPKGCEITHENAVQAMMSFQKLFEGHWTEDSKWLQFASFHFDVSVLEQFWSWSVGICVASAPRDLIFEDIPGIIRKLGITHIDLTPSLARLLHPDDASSLTKGVFITGGEQLRQEILDAWGDSECIYNGYGPTEATIGVTMYPRVPRSGKPSNIGPQFQNVGSYVFKLGTTEPVLRGAIGELCVSGKLLGKGYLNRPELTKERFPYLDEFGERVYRTGDLVRILHDGSFLFLGRADDQVKLRGQRLELSEINEVIKKELHEIQDVVTLVLQHSKQQKEQLVTFYVPFAAGKTSSSIADLPGSLRNECQRCLPGYMVPTYFIALDKLPLSANNKADLKELAKIFDKMSISDLQNLDFANHATKKWTAKEQSVLEVLAKCTNVDLESITKSSNIFELGLDSISVISLVRSLHEQGYRNATLSLVMKNTSINSLVRMLATDENENEHLSHQLLVASQRIAAFAHRHKLLAADELGIDASEIECLAPCTPAQEGMIYKFLGSEEALYFSTFNFALKDSLDEERLHDAWKRAASRLQILRTKFVLTSDGCAQVVLRDLKLNWKTTSMQSINEDDMQAKIQERDGVVHATNKVTALTNPFKISIIHAKTKRTMSLHIFHALYDGTSLPLLLHAVYSEYQHIPPKNIPYGPAFHDVLPYGPLAPIPTAESFWRTALKTHKHHPLPRLRSSPPPPPPIGKGKAISATTIIPALEIQHLLPLRTSLGITYQAILLGAWSSVLACILQSHDAPTPTFALTQGLILSGRSFSLPLSPAAASGSADTDPQNVIGPLLNTVPFHVSISDGMSWKELLQTVHAFCVQVVADGFAHTALRDVLRWCSGDENGSADDRVRLGRRRELFDTLFVCQPEGTRDAGVGNEGALWEALPGDAVADYPLAFEAQLNNNGDIALTLVGQKEFIDDAAAVDILTKVERALQDLKSPEQAIHSLSNTNRTQINPNNAVETKARIHLPSALSDEIFKWTPEAQQIKSEIESLSGISDISEHSSIFSLGLDSIDIIKLVSRLRKRSIQISVSSIVKSQSIAKMVKNISKFEPRSEKAMTSVREYERKLTKHLRAAGRLPGDVVTVLPATPLQEGMVAEMIASAYTRYLNHEVFRVPHQVDMQKLKDAWDAVVAKNDILRTQFIEVDDVDLPMSFTQVVCQSAASYWRGINLPRSIKLREGIEKIILSAVEVAREGKLLQLQDVKYGEEQYFVLSIAHALYDGWSLQSLHQDVWAAYHGQLGTRPDARPTLELIMDTDGPEAEWFWKSSLTGLQNSTFPARPAHEVQNNGVVHRRELPTSHPLDKIQSFCRSASISLQTLGQTIWAIVLATHLQKLDVVFGVVLSCRDSEDADELMFPLMNTVAVRSVIHGSISELLHYMQENGNAIRWYQHFPLRKAQALAGMREGSLFDTLFIYQGRARKTIAEEDRLYEDVDSVADVEFAVCVEMEIVDGKLVWRTACKDEVLTGVETEALLDCLDGVLGTIIQRPDDPTIRSNSEGISLCGLRRFVDDDGCRAIEKATKPASIASRNPWIATEATIRRVLSQVSKISEEQIDRNQTIFHLGLDSISAIKVSSILRREGIWLTVNDILKRNTIDSMAKLMDDRHEPRIEKSFDVEEALTNSMKDFDREEVIQRAELDPENVEDILPITAGQLYMLARWQISGGASFVGTFKYRIPGAIETDRLERAWKALLKKHPVLRTIFVVLGYRNPPAVQIVLKDVENNIKWASSSASENKISLTSPLSLSVEKREDDTVLCLRIHHALYDGVSLPLLLQDLQALYASPSTHVDPDSSFRQFVARSCDRQNQILQRRSQFWKSYLTKPTLIYTRDMPESNGHKRVEVFEPDNSIKNVALFSQRNGVSVDALLLAAFSKVYLSLFDNRRDTTIQEASVPKAGNNVVFGLYLANRAVYDEDLSSLAAPTLNLLPICISPYGSMTQIAQKVQSDLQKLSSADIAGTSLAEIHDWTGVSVNCFVNILKPTDNSNNNYDNDDAAAQGPSSPAQSLFLESSGDERRRRAEIVDVRYDPLLKAAAAEEGVSKFHEAYTPSLDIEMRVTDGGARLDIGVFAPWEYMHIEDARGVVGEIRTQLSSL